MNYKTDFYPNFFKAIRSYDEKIINGENYKITIGDYIIFNTSNSGSSGIRMHGFRIKVKLDTLPEQDIIIAHTEKDPQSNICISDYGQRAAGQILWFHTKNYFDENTNRFFHTGVFGGKVKPKKMDLIDEIAKRNYLEIDKKKIIILKVSGNDADDYHSFLINLAIYGALRNYLKKMAVNKSINFTAAKKTVVTKRKEDGSAAKNDRKRYNNTLDASAKDIDLSSILQYSEKYKKDFLSNDIKIKNEILNKHYYSLKFFFGKTFFQHFSDDVNYNFFQKTLKILDKSFGIGADWDFLLNPQSSFDAVMQDLADQLRDENIINARIRLVVSTLQFVRDFYPQTIIGFLLDYINKNNVLETQEYLIRRIYGIGPKVSSFVLRDLVQVYDDVLINKGKDEFWNEYFALNPIDVHVKKAAEAMGIIHSKDVSRMETNIAIINFCRRSGCSPIDFNQGAYLYSKENRL
jgi:hypothetical protein